MTREDLIREREAILQDEYVPTTEELRADYVLGARNPYVAGELFDSWVRLIEIEALLKENL